MAGIKNRKAQVALFVIVAVVIVALAILLYILFPNIRTAIGGEPQTPQGFLESCLKASVDESVKVVGLQGGTLTPKNYVLHEGSQVEYLCYSNEYYRPCVMQYPVLKTQVENEIEKSVSGKVDECLNELKSSYENRGYSVSITSKSVAGSNEVASNLVELFPGAIIINVDKTISLRAGEGESILLNGIQIREKSGLYDLIMIATSILNWEARYGDADSATYMTYYPNIKVEKNTNTDGTRVYILTDRESEIKFQFASRSIALPPLYGADEINIQE